MAKEIQAPNPWPKDAFSIFLAGSIDGGEAAPWQKHVVEALADYKVRPDIFQTLCAVETILTITMGFGPAFG